MRDSLMVSVVIPIYNGESYIEDTIRSVIDQSYQNFEIVVVDNYSDDKSAQIVCALATQDSRIKYIKLDFNSGGPARPRNIGIQNSNGALVAFLDADDIWEKNKLEKQISFLVDNDFDFVSSDYSFIDNQGMPIRISTASAVKKFLFSINHTIKSTIFFSNIYTSSVLVKKSDELIFDEDTLLMAAEDWYLWLTLLSKGRKHGFLKEELIRYRITDNSTVGRADPKKIRIRQAYCLSKFLLVNRLYLYWPIFRLRQLLSF